MIDGNLAMNAHFENMPEKDSNEGYDNYIDEFVKKESISFAEWAAVNGWYFNKIQRWSNRGEKSDNLIEVLSNTKSTTELYQLYKESQQTKTL